MLPVWSGGAAEVVVVTCICEGLPAAMAWASDDSKSTSFDLKPGVSTFATLLATVCCWAHKPCIAWYTADEARSPKLPPVIVVPR